MTDVQQRAAAKAFVKQWTGKGYEKGESQPFWLSLLREVLGIEKPETFIRFEEQVHLDNTSFIDGYIDATKVMIEQKALGKDLNKPIKQSDGSLLNPFQQAKRYAAELPYSQRPRWIVTCNFEKFCIYDMERPQGEPETVQLADLEKEYYRLSFLTDTGNDKIRKEMEISLAAGELVGKLYELLLKQYADPTNPASLRSLNILCVRLVFCLYAEDAGLFGKHDTFHDYIHGFLSKNVRTGLIDLFKTLDTKPEDRDPYMDEALAAFPYVNGGLFADENIEIPRLTDEIVHLITEDCSADFNWSGISPTIFGAVFESTLNPETRRSGGMHYTSIENIHKVIDPLFLNDLKKEYQEICAIPVERTRDGRLKEYQDKLSKLSFLDPACGSGNFLTETYISLRRLENDVLRQLYTDDSAFINFGEGFTPIKVSISQFYGIEINDFAVTVARTALWISEAQMMKETEDIVGESLNYLPLKNYEHIIEGNALTTDWNTVVPKEKLNYIMGNPPFVGYSLQSEEQKKNILSVYIDENGKPYKTAGKIDFVAGWYFKAAQLIQGTNVQCAFVSTNSICQGEQVASVWAPLFQRFNTTINFAYRTFRWDSEAKLKAHVHCIIVGFSDCAAKKEKLIINESGISTPAKNINAYLIDAANVFVESRTKPICNVPEMVYGNKPTDGGFLFIEDKDYFDFINKEPRSKKYIHQIYGSEEYINNKTRYCIWLKDAQPSELRSMPLVMQRIESVRDFRLSSPKKETQVSANNSSLFQEIRQPDTNFIIVPRVSSERRKYVPIGFLSPEIIVNDSVQIIPNATIYHFGILTSNVHMAWMRAVCGRLKSDYRYSKDVVYNNFPWPTPTDEQKATIEKTAQAILDARALYPDSSLADLYDDLTMPVELRKAHQDNDRAVMTAYGFPISTFTETDCVAALMHLYQNLTAEHK